MTDEEQDQESFADEPAARPLWAATWFRAVLVILAVGVVGAVATPYLLDLVNPPPAVVLAPVPPAPGAVASRPDAPGPTGPAEAPSSPDSAAAAIPGHPTGATSDREEPSAAAAAPEPVTKPAPAVRPAAKAATAPPRTARARRPAASVPVGGAGEYWVQVGAFRDPETAQRLATRLRRDNYRVVESTTHAAAPAAAPSAAVLPTPAPRPPAVSAAPPDRYDVFVSGLPLEELRSRIAAQGLAADADGDGVVITPSLPLKDAVALSKDLAVDGLKVQVQRAAGADAPAASPPAAPPPPAAPAPGPTPDASPVETTLHRVRVGAFPDRASALVVVRELEAKGYRPFVAREPR